MQFYFLEKSFKCEVYTRIAKKGNVFTKFQIKLQVDLFEKKSIAITRFQLRWYVGRRNIIAPWADS